MIVNGTKGPLRSILRRYEVVAPDTFHHVQLCHIVMVLLSRASIRPIDGDPPVPLGC
jgi:hypothetical protein